MPLESAPLGTPSSSADTGAGMRLSPSDIASLIGRRWVPPPEGVPGVGSTTTATAPPNDCCGLPDRFHRRMPRRCVDSLRAGKPIITHDLGEPSVGLEPTTPSLPWTKTPAAGASSRLLKPPY